MTPLRSTILSIDWYRVELDSLVGTNNSTTIVQNNNPADVIRDERGKLVAVYNRYQNLSELKTSGVDLELSQRWRTDRWGDFALQTAYTHVIDYRRPVTIGGPLVDYAGTNRSGSLPADKATTRAGWSKGDLEADLTWYYTGGYDLTTVVTGQSSVDAYNQVDLYLGWSGLEKAKVYVKIENIADETPPYDGAFPGIRAPYDFSQYDLRGRQFRIGFDYRF